MSEVDWLAWIQYYLIITDKILITIIIHLLGIPQNEFHYPSNYVTAPLT